MEMIMEYKTTIQLITMFCHKEDILTPHVPLTRECGPT